MSSMSNGTLDIPRQHIGARGGDLAGAQREGAEVGKLLHCSGDVSGAFGADLTVIQIQGSQLGQVQQCAGQLLGRLGVEVIAWNNIITEKIRYRR